MSLTADLLTADPIPRVLIDGRCRRAAETPRSLRAWDRTCGQRACGRQLFLKRSPQRPAAATRLSALEVELDPGQRRGRVNPVFSRLQRFTPRAHSARSKSGMRGPWLSERRRELFIGAVSSGPHKTGEGDRGWSVTDLRCFLICDLGSSWLVRCRHCGAGWIPSKSQGLPSPEKLIEHAADHQSGKASRREQDLHEHLRAVRLTLLRYAFDELVEARVHPEREIYQHWNESIEDQLLTLRQEDSHESPRS